MRTAPIYGFEFTRAFEVAGLTFAPIEQLRAAAPALARDVNRHHLTGTVHGARLDEPRCFQLNAVLAFIEHMDVVVFTAITYRKRKHACPSLAKDRTSKSPSVLTADDFQMETPADATHPFGQLLTLEVGLSVTLGFARRCRMATKSLRSKATVQARGSRFEPDSNSGDPPSLDSDDPWGGTTDSQDSADSQDPPTLDSDDPWSEDSGGSVDFGFPYRFVAVVDPVLVLGEDAARRIERALRAAVLAEIAHLDFLGDLIVSSILPDGSRGISVRSIRG